MSRLRSFASLPLLLCAGLLVQPSMVSAQQSQKPAFAPPAFTPTAKNYLLGPGDVLRIIVAGFPDYSQESLIIAPDGTASLPRLGTLVLTGRTVASVQEDVRQRLIARVRLRNPQVSVLLTQARSGVSGNVVLIGDVPRTGTFPVKESERLSDLLAEAGVNARLEEKRAVLVRGNTRVSLNLNAAAKTPGSAADVRLQPGDSISVSTIAPGQIILSGDIERPGAYELHLQPVAGAYELSLRPRLSELISKAGGLRNPNGGDGGSVAPGTGGATAGANLGTGTGRNPFALGGTTPAPATGANNTNPFAITTPLQSTTLPVAASAPAPAMKTSYTATLQRSGTRRELDVEAALANITGPENVILRAGDNISIDAKRPITVLVDGAVSKPGAIQVAPGAGVLELITLAGPLTRAPGDLNASIRRGNQSIPLNLTALLLNNDPSANEKLQNGDIVQLREPETVNISVAGQVARPGFVKVRPGATIFEAVLAAGGVSTGVPLENAKLNVLRRENNGSQRVYAANAAGIFKLTDVSTNMVLREGDIINIAGGEAPTVFLSGEVVSPNSYPITPGEGLAEVITRAGGPKDDAALTRVRVTRGSVVQTIDAYDAVKNGTPLAFNLQSGDLVNVPITTNRISVLGAVAKADTYSIPEKGQLRVLDALTKAAPVAGAQKFYIVKTNVDGTVNVQATSNEEFSIQDIQRGKKPNLILAPRDVVYVLPPKGPKPGILSAINSVGFLLPFLF